MKIKKISLFVACLLLILMILPPVKVLAINRTATITGPAKAHKGETITLTVGFNSKEDTRSCDFTFTYREDLLTFAGVTMAPGLPKSAIVKNTTGASPLTLGIVDMGEAPFRADKILTVRFKVIGTGNATLKITEASDGIYDPANNISTGSLTLNLTDPPVTTTTTAQPTTSKTTTKATTTKPTSSVSTVSTIPSETRPTFPAQASIGKRYDGVMLSIPETSPSDGAIPESFRPKEVEWEGKQLTGYESNTLPYTLYWLSDETLPARFYYADAQAGVFVPFYRSEWSSRYFTFAVLSEQAVPDGFELTTLSVRGNDVPAYRPVKGYYFTKSAYEELRSKVTPGMTLPDWKTYEGDDSLDEPARDDLWQGVSVAVPGDLYLVALRMNDAEDKMMYLYDHELDSLIRADLWLVPVAGSYLELGLEDIPPVPTEPTEPAMTESEKTEQPAVTETLVAENTVTLFGRRIPISVLVAAIAVLIIVIASGVWLVARIRRVIKHEPELTLADFHDEDYDLQEEPMDEERKTQSQSTQEGSSIVDLSEESSTQTPELMTGVTGGIAVAKREDDDRPVDSDEGTEDLESGWRSLDETLRKHEDKDAVHESRPDESGIRQFRQRRAGRDDPSDRDEL
ncbi:MAG: hypothetical protein GX850_05550 [Clostridiaceae bacterium]|nr:hypothetical protein [Clostridiaceae bacterium]